jgi:uncharacterized protein (TIGR03437 family)
VYAWGYGSDGELGDGMIVNSGVPVKVSLPTGTTVTGATTVQFGTAKATFTVVSATKITATAPAGTGTVAVTVTTPLGTSAQTTADRFTYGA